MRTSASCSTACLAMPPSSPEPTRGNRRGASAPPSSTAGALIHRTRTASPTTKREHGVQRKRELSSSATVANGTVRECAAVSVTTAPSPLRYRHASGLHAVTGALHQLHYELLTSRGDDRSQVRTS